MSLTQTTVTLQGIEVPISRKGHGRPLLMLHGGGGPVASRPFADLLAQHMEVIEPVHPGFAGTAIPDHFDGMEDLVYLYLDLMDALDLQDAVLMGFSMGGWTAAEIAVRNLQRIGQLILVDALGIKPGGRDDRDIPDIFAMSPEDVERLMWHDPAKAPGATQRSDEEWQAAAANRVALGMYTWDPYMHNPKLPNRLQRISVPTLLLWGASDRLVTPDYGRAYAGLIPQADLRVIGAAGHAPHIEQPEAFARRVLDFVALRSAA
ncbi:MAG: alpha/beta hydrolase [Pigmentiphaga sp.]|uniref:alpha/beta fold hydrolase n=1 Tax=Pigmentiphaga sp. TaxID=1977564 RepID=UPI0029BF5FC5|nr:alpha/beta hydrolase [Pigmentiphaga sp.]MDX3907974.1 alpha/beta hydrolase [Pigmentiphaga sp.]